MILQSPLSWWLWEGNLSFYAQERYKSSNLIFIQPKCLYSQSAIAEVKYDIQVFADRIEFCWIHLRGIGALENSLWAYDGDGMRVWLNALSMDSPQLSDTSSPENVKESVKIPLDFYPLCESSYYWTFSRDLTKFLKLSSWTKV